MAFESANTRRLRGKAAVAAKWNHPDAADLRRDYCAAKLADYVKREVDKAPPLTSEQVDRITLLLRKRPS